jgi:hypothetical protein
MACDLETHVAEGIHTSSRWVEKSATSRTGKTVRHPRQDVGVDVRTSCEERVCSACEKAVIRELPDCRNSILTEDRACRLQAHEDPAQAWATRAISDQRRIVRARPLRVLGVAVLFDPCTIVWRCAFKNAFRRAPMLVNSLSRSEPSDAHHAT